MLHLCLVPNGPCPLMHSAQWELTCARASWGFSLIDSQKVLVINVLIFSQKSVFCSLFWLSTAGVELHQLPDVYRWTCMLLGKNMQQLLLSCAFSYQQKRENQEELNQETFQLYRTVLTSCSFQLQRWGVYLHGRPVQVGRINTG